MYGFKSGRRTTKWWMGWVIEDITWKREGSKCRKILTVLTLNNGKGAKDNVPSHNICSTLTDILQYLNILVHYKLNTPCKCAKSSCGGKK